MCCSSALVVLPLYRHPGTVHGCILFSVTSEQLFWDVEVLTLDTFVIHGRCQALKLPHLDIPVLCVQNTISHKT
jgi:hypothetical protein